MKYGRKGLHLIDDSMLYGIDGKSIKNTKVRIFPWASVEKLFYNISPTLRKKPSNITCHIGTNNKINDNSSEVKRIHPSNRNSSRRGAVVKGVEHIWTNLKVNIWVPRVRVPLVLSVGIWIRKNSTINT